MPKYPNYKAQIQIQVSPTTIKRLRRNLRAKKRIERDLRKTNPEAAAQLRLEIARDEANINNLESMTLQSQGLRSVRSARGVRPVNIPQEPQPHLSPATIQEAQKSGFVVRKA